MIELQTILGADKGRNAFYKARDNFTILQEFANDANDNFIELFNQIVDITNQTALKTFPTTTEALIYINKTSDLSISPYVTTLNGWDVDAVSIDRLPPIGRGWWNIFHISVLSGYPPWVPENLALQYWMLNGYADNPTIYIRYCINNTWTQFKRILGSDNWISATLQNGWTGTLQYRKNQIGQTEISGRVKPGTRTFGTVMAQIPAQYAHPDRVFPLDMYGTNGEVFTGVVLEVNGSIKIYLPYSGNSGTHDLFISAVIPI